MGTGGGRGGGQGGGGTSAASGPSAKQQAARKVTKMCLIIATTFTVAWLPLQLNLLVLAYGNRSHALLLIEVVATLAFANSCVNPIVYAFKWKPFRDSLIQVRRSLSAVMPTKGHIAVRPFAMRPCVSSYQCHVRKLYN